MPDENNDNIVTTNDIDKPELALGLKIPTSIRVPASYLDGLRKYKDIYNDIYKQMEVANKLYRFNGIIGNAVDVLVDFAVTKVEPLDTGDKRLNSMLNHWFETLNSENSNTLPGVNCLSEELSLEWFTSGNAFPYAKWSHVTVDKATVKLPTSIYLMNPQGINIPEGPIAFGQEVIYLKYDSKLIDKLRGDGRRDPEAALIKAAIPRSVLTALTSQERRTELGVRLNPKFIKHLKRRAKGYQPWGVPYLSRAFSSVSILERLRELDESVASGLLNLVTIFKIGTEEHPASPLRLRKFAALLKNPRATTTLVWAHDVEIEQVGPDGKILQFKNKYDDAKEDTLIALGIPPVLMSLKQSGDAWVSILSLVERLSHWRKQITLYIEGLCNQIAENNGFENRSIKVKWERMNLTDDQAIKNLVLAFHDRGLISIKTTLKESGYSFESEVKSRKQEESSGIKEVFMPPQLPFTGSNDQGRPKDSAIPTKVKKKDKTDSDKTVDLKAQVKKSKPKEPAR